MRLMEESYPNGKEIDMNDLIERLRDALSEDANEAADEIDRSQALITAMTKDIESMKPWRELQRENEELRNRHKELREANLYLNERLREAIKELHPLKGRQELAALKVQSAEQPVALRELCLRVAMEVNAANRMKQIRKLEDIVDEVIEANIALAALKAQSTEPVAWKDTTYGNLHHQKFGDCIPLYLAPPQATALVDDFKRRAIEVCRYYEESAKKTNRWDVALGAMTCVDAIESLPLINDFNQGEK